MNFFSFTSSVSLGLLMTILIKQGECNSTISILKFPYFASIESNNRHVCSGAVIDHRFIYTSTTCGSKLNLTSDSINVRVGMDYRGFRGEVIPVVEINTGEVIMPVINYGSAILQLATSIKYRKKVEWVNMAKEVSGEVVGEIPLWLDTKWKSGLSSSTMKVMNHADCVSLYEGTFNIDDAKECLEPVTNSELACLVDIGSPFITQGQLFGTVAYPATCNPTKNLPLVINLVPADTEFIVLTITSLSDLLLLSSQ